MIRLIVAHDEARGIGYKNKLLYHIKEDLQRFKRLTEGHVVVMGRKTHESLPVSILPHRVNVVLTRDKNYKPRNSNVIVMHDVETILNHYKSGKQDKDVFIIGGDSIYNAFIEHADVVHITYIHATRKADTHLGIVEDMNCFEEVFTPYKIETYMTDCKDKIMYQFIDYVHWRMFSKYHELQKEKEDE